LGQNVKCHLTGPATFHEWQYLLSSITHGGSHHCLCTNDCFSLRR